MTLRLDRPNEPVGLVTVSGSREEITTLVAVLERMGFTVAQVDDAEAARLRDEVGSTGELP